MQVKSDYDYLIKFYKSLSKDAQKKRRLVPAAEWFLDNFHIISEQVKEIEYSLPRGHYHSLPILRDGNYKGKPRIYAIAVDIVLLADGKLEEEIISTFWKVIKQKPSYYCRTLGCAFYVENSTNKENTKLLKKWKNHKTILKRRNLV